MDSFDIGWEGYGVGWKEGEKVRSDSYALARKRDVTERSMVGKGLNVKEMNVNKRDMNELEREGKTKQRERGKEKKRRYPRNSKKKKRGGGIKMEE